MECIRIGVIGCGEIAQVMHLPYLSELPAFELVAISDLSEAVLDQVGDRYNVLHRSTNYNDVLPHVDAVAVLTNQHATIAEAAARHGKHVFVEKPLGHSLDECGRVLAAVAETGVKLMVGYMRRFDPGYEHASTLMGDIGAIRFVRVHDFGGSFAVHPGLYTLYRADDVANSVLEEGRQGVHDIMLQALGADRRHLIDTYYETLMSGIHNLAMLRGLLGQPLGVLHSERLGANGLLSLLDYGGGRICSFEQLLMEDHTWWDQSLTVYGDAAVVTIDLPNPYVRNAPTVVRVERTDTALPVLHETPVSYDSPFRREWAHFADCIQHDREPRTSGSDARDDVAIAIAMVQAIASADDPTKARHGAAAALTS